MKQHRHTSTIQKGSRVKWINGNKSGTGTVKLKKSCAWWLDADYIIVDDATGAELEIPFQRLSSLGSKRQIKEEIFYGLTKTKKRKKGS